MYIALFQRYLEVTKMTIQTDLNKICIYCTVFNIEYQVDKHVNYLQMQRFSEDTEKGHKWSAFN